MAIAPEGKPILLLAALIAIFCVSAGLVLGDRMAPWMGTLGLLPLAFSLYFFRDPVRITPPQSGLVVAPADGKIIEIVAVGSGPVHPAAARKISIFMSPLNVHVNRIPLGGVVQDLRYHRGRFHAAYEPKASLDNERQYVGLETPYGQVGCVQIAGWLARRIVCHVQLGQQVTTGQRYGLIRFGSRLDVYLPPSCSVRIGVGQKVKAGETIIGVLHEMV